MTAGPASGPESPASPVQELPFVGRETPLAALLSAVQAAEAREEAAATGDARFRLFESVTEVFTTAS